jgi:hypothetical protein
MRVIPEQTPREHDEPQLAHEERESGEEVFAGEVVDEDRPPIEAANHDVDGPGFVRAMRSCHVLHPAGP